MHRISLVLCVSISCSFYVVKSGIDAEHAQYLDSLGSECGLLHQTRTPTANARIINAISATQHYPWVARIYITYNVIDADGKPFKQTATSGGSIITPKLVLTCGHCICIFEQTTEETRTKPRTCRVDQVGSLEQKN